MLGVCKRCKKEYRKRERTRKFCSLTCASRYNLNGINKVILPNRSQSLSEFIGICLGDGYAWGYQTGITLNYIADRKYITFVENLAKSLFPGATFSTIKRKKENAVDIRINSKIVVDFLKTNGIISNAKVVPNWILEKEEYRRSCVRGLFDTEGHISFKIYQSRKRVSVYKQLNFRNSNMVLMGFVKDCLINLGLKPTTTMKRSLYLSNHESVDIYREQIGFSNPKLYERSLICDIDNYQMGRKSMKKPIISLTSDFGVQSQGIGNMEGVILSIAPQAHVIHLMHGLPDFDIRAGARTMETSQYLPIGFHVCVVDPGVGSNRKAIIIQTKRGDFLIGPDNGVLVPAINFLGGFVKAVQITNRKLMLQPVSPIFHGRHIFAPAAAHLANGVKIDDFGPEISFNELILPPYKEATVKNNTIEAEVININKFGSLNLNILHKTWDDFDVKLGEKVMLKFDTQQIEIPYAETFGQIEASLPLILKDDYGRVEVAINLGGFAEKYQIKIGDSCVVKKL